MTVLATEEFSLKTEQVRFSEDVIKRHLADPEIGQLKDPRYPLALRFNKSRSKASWHYVLYKDGQDIWKKIGSWPLISWSQVKKQLPKLSEQLAAGQHLKSLCFDHFEQCEPLLIWYRDRTLSNRSMSRQRASNVKSVIDKHLLPCLGSLDISHVGKFTLEESLIWPKQENYQVSTVKAMFNVLSAAFTQARALDLISFNPMSEIKFSDFVPGKLPLREGKIKVSHLSGIMSVSDESTMSGMLTLMLLCHGTRIGETLLAKWDDFDLTTMLWTIPAVNNKPRREHTLPITDFVYQILKSHRNRLKEQGYEGRYLFPVQTRRGFKNSPVSEQQGHKWIKEISGGDWTSHDARKRCGSSWMANGEDYYIIKFVLNHSVERLDQTYMQDTINPRKLALLERWQDFLIQQKTKTIPRW